MECIGKLNFDAEKPAQVFRDGLRLAYPPCWDQLPVRMVELLRILQEADSSLKE